MTNFECCKTKSFPSSYYLCINCFKVYHKSCVLKDKANYTFVNGFKLKCCESDEELLKKTIDEKSILEETILEMSENSQLREKHISKLKVEHEKLLEEVTAREDELNSFINEQQALLEKANKEIQKLRQDIFHFTNKLMDSKYTQTIENKTTTSSTQTCQKNSATSNMQSYVIQKNIRLYHQNNPTHKISKGKILIVSGEFGKDLVHNLQNYMREWRVNSILKPHATNTELVDTAIVSSRNFTKQDILIFWPNEYINCHINKLYSSLTHTNFLILSTPYVSKSYDFNERVYHSNLSLFKSVRELTGNLKCVIDINSILIKSNYTHNIHRINRTGKKYVAMYLAKYITLLEISYKEDVTTADSVTKSTSTDMAVLEYAVSPQIISENCHIQSPSQNSESLTKSATATQHFLYPRLSQITLLEH